MMRLVRAVGICAVLAALGLAGCGDPPWIMSQSRQAIYLRWYPDLTASSQADEVAQLHCTGSGRRAVLANSQRDGSAQTATYRCE